jgi:hypothetical protein
MQKDLHVLCYQHHGKMLLELPSEPTEVCLYACREPGCLVHYDSSNGYSLDEQDPKVIEKETLPRLRCLLDDRPMFLAGVSPERRSFRLWKCPECDASRTDDESSIGLEKKMGA